MRHIIPELELEEIENLAKLDLSEAPESITEEKIAYRRKRVNQLRLRGYTNQQIAQKIGCNLSTVEKDLCSIREKTRHWFEEDSIIEYCQSINDSIILYDNMIEDLQILYSHETELDQKLKILSMISECETKKTELFEKTRAVRRFVRENKMNPEGASK